MRCLVTGADGFLGSHLVDALLASDECSKVVALVHRQPVRWLPIRKYLDKLVVVQADVRRSSSLVEVPNADVIYHLAGISSMGRCENAPEAARLVNFQGTINMLNLALEMRRSPLFVFASTAALYGEPQYLPVDERHPVEPKNSYTYTKMSSEITVTAYHRDQGLPMTIVRPFNIYGPRQTEDFVVPTIINQVLQGVQLRLGDGRPLRNFTYVTDAAQFLLRIPLSRG
ncbi:MAG: NAD-dependent epimerase/dehydratase family protein, partial [Thermoplasmata archaeon]